MACSHCGATFTVGTGTQINCNQKGWELPKRCENCRELFRHKPFRTIKETDFFANPVFRTFNSLGQLISESRDETGILGDERRRHSSRFGKTVGITRDRTDFLGNPYRETTGPDGGVKSRSREGTGIFGDKYTESSGGSSNTKHVTRPKKDVFGNEYRETE
jgi:hypothetical protein